ncbi:MAG: hypothetical protein Q9214_004384 [Letrouitia sp. 1 TL-2023]
MIRNLVYVVVGLVLLAYVVDFLFSLLDDPREPPRLRPKVPLIGHLLGIMQNGPTNRTDAEIYTLGIFNFKFYVSASSRLLPFIQKQSKALAFRPFLQIVARKHGDVSNEAYEIFGGTLVDDLSHSVTRSLMPGPSLDDLNLKMGRRALLEVDALLDPNRYQGQQVYLLEWVRHAVVQATSCAVYGEKHPFLEPEVEKAYWLVSIDGSHEAD